MKKLTQLAVLSLSFAPGISMAQVQVEADGTGGKEITYLEKVGSNVIFFGVKEGTLDYDMFANDGVNNSVLSTLCSVSVSSVPGKITEANGKGYTYWNYSGNANGAEPWITDGTAAGTFLLKDINPGTGSSNNSVTGNPNFFIPIGTKVFFNANNGTTGCELWITDGTTAGTTLVKDIYPGSTTSDINNPVVYNNELWFRAKSSSGTFNLFRSDGTTAGTTQFVYPSTLSGSPDYLLVYNGYLYFTGLTTAAKRALWRTDGTTAGTVKIFEGSGNVGTPSPFNAINNQILGISTDPLSWPYVYSLYAIDVTSLDTTLLKTGINLVSGQAGNGWTINSKIVFLGKTAAAGDEPWVTDGTPAGTSMLADINSGTASSNLYSHVAYYGGELYFNTQLSNVWKTDGTVGGTQSAGFSIDGNEYNSLTGFNSNIYFIKASAVTGKRKLWKLSNLSGIEEVSDEELLSLYPNPSSGTVNLKSKSNEKGTILVYNSIGQLVYQSSLTNPDQAIDLERLENGLYQVIMKTEKRTYHNKVLIQK